MYLMSPDNWVSFKITFSAKKGFPYELSRNSKWIFLQKVSFQICWKTRISIFKFSLYFFLLDFKKRFYSYDILRGK